MQLKAVYFCIFLRPLTLVSPNSTQIHAELTGTFHKVRIYAALVSWENHPISPSPGFFICTVR